MQIDFLKLEIDKLEGRGPINSSNTTLSKAKWTGTHIEATELIYAITSSNCINNGNIDFKELIELLGQVIDLPDFDIYRSITDIKNRKKNQTVFLDKVKARLLKKINEIIR